MRRDMRYLELLTEERGLRVVSVQDDLGWSEAARRTVEAMRAGAQVIYQASLLTSEWYEPQSDPDDKLKEALIKFSSISGASLECGGLAPLCYSGTTTSKFCFTKAVPGHRTPRRRANSTLSIELDQSFRKFIGHPEWYGRGGLFC